VPTDDVVPSEAPVSTSALHAYTVAPGMPRMLSIPSIGVDARILRMSLTKEGAVQAPTGIWDTGWYDGSAKPGQSGNAFIDGHISGPTMPAVFKDLKNIRIDAKVQVERGDGAQLTYAVSSVTTKKLDQIDMSAVLAGPGGDSLTIMTCGGSYLGNYTYDSRVIVVAKRA
jgi:LPXTG-site transpeptidase (sortase) family protein